MRLRECDDFWPSLRVFLADRLTAMRTEIEGLAQVAEQPPETLRVCGGIAAGPLVELIETAVHTHEPRVLRLGWQEVWVCAMSGESWPCQPLRGVLALFCEHRDFRPDWLT